MLIDIVRTFLQCRQALSQRADNSGQMLINGAQPPLQFSLSLHDSLIQGLRHVPLGMIQPFHASTHGTQGDLPRSRLPDLA